MIELEKFEEAVKDCEAACTVEQGNRDLEAMLKEAKLELKKSKRKNYYKILEVTKDASEHDIKRAYKKAALKHHPDRCKEESEREKFEANFKNVGEAYVSADSGVFSCCKGVCATVLTHVNALINWSLTVCAMHTCRYGVLSDPDKRSRYDQGADIEDLQGEGHGHGHGDADMFRHFFNRGGGGGGGFGGF